MPKKTWTKKDERQRDAIYAQCMTDRRGKKTCSRIANATVNKRVSARRRRRQLGRTPDCGCSG